MMTGLRGEDVLRRFAAWVIVLSAALASATLVSAHGVAVDGDPADWTGVPPPGGGYDPVAGEWIWQATDTITPLQEFRVTADETYVYFLVRLAEIKAARGEGAPLVQIAVDTDRRQDSGQSVFVGLTRSRLAAGPANWERLIRTSFATGRLSPAVLDPNLADVAAGDDIAILAPQRKTIEMRVRWADLGIAPPTTLRLTTALFTADRRENVLPEDGLALAAVTPSNASLGTLDRIAAYFDVSFRADGAAVPPPAPVRVAGRDIPLPPLLREPLLYAVVGGMVFVLLGVAFRLRARPKSWWWG